MRGSETWGAFTVYFRPPTFLPFCQRNQPGNNTVSHDIIKFTYLAYCTGLCAYTYLQPIQLILTCPASYLIMPCDMSCDLYRVNCVM